MDAFLSRFTIRQKLWGGFGLLLLVLTLVASIAFFSLRGVQQDMSVVVDDIQPTVIASMELTSGLNQATSSLGFYLLSGEDLHRDNFYAALKRVDASMATLAGRVAADSALSARLTALRTDIDSFKRQGVEMLTLVNDQAKNVPGIAYAAQNINPLSQEMLNIATQMIMSESEEPATAQRKQLMSDLHALRYGLPWVL